MKVALLYGGMGLRMQEASRRIPKPMIPTGGEPMRWRVVKYFGHNEFIVSLGHKSDVITEDFLNYKDGMSNDFVPRAQGQCVTLPNDDIPDWKISFIQTGHSANVGQRLRRVREHIGDDDHFLANDGDTLTEAPLDRMIDNLKMLGHNSPPREVPAAVP